MPWVDIYRIGGAYPAPPDAGPSERIWQRHWDTLGEWVRHLPRQIKVPGLARLLAGKLPVDLAPNQVLRLEGELTMLRHHPLAGHPLGSWASSRRDGVEVCQLVASPRDGIGILALAVGNVANFGGRLRFVLGSDSEPGAAAHGGA